MANEILQDSKTIGVTPSAVNGNGGNGEAKKPETRVRWGTLVKYLLIAVVAMFLLLVLLDKVLMPWYVKLGAVESVPNVVGLPFAEASSKLQKLGFEVKKGEPRFD